MAKPKSDRSDDPDYEPTQAELEEPITVDAPTPEALGEAVMRHKGNYFRV